MSILCGRSRDRRTPAGQHAAGCGDGLGRGSGRGHTLGPGVNPDDTRDARHPLRALQDQGIRVTASLGQSFAVVQAVVVIAGMMGFR